VVIDNFWITENRDVPRSHIWQCWWANTKAGRLYWVLHDQTYLKV